MLVSETSLALKESLIERAWLREGGAEGSRGRAAGPLWSCLCLWAMAPLVSVLGRLLTPPLTVEEAQLVLGHNAETQ